jgi:hypothetical protein
VSWESRLMLIGSLLSAVLGAAVTLGVAWLASRSARETLRLARRTIGEIGLLLRGLEEAELVEYNRDEDGRALGLVINVSAEGSSTSAGRATVEVSRADKQPPEGD